MKLQRMGPDLWGGAFEIRRWEPGLEVLEDVYCLPHREGGQWGVFDSADRVVPGSVNREHSTDQTIGQDPTSYLRADDIAEWLPDGDYLYGGRYAFHFGHFLNESLARLWPLAEGKRPGQKIIVHGGGGGDGWFNDPTQAEILGGLGLTPEDFIYADRPFRIRRLTLPHMSYQMARFGHPAYTRLCRAIGSNLVGGVWPRRNYTPVWLSKSRLQGGVRRVVNEDRVEAVLERNGVEIVHPQTLSFTEKVQLFASRATIMGTLQASHNVSIFAPPAGKLLTLFPYKIVGTNHITIDVLNGNDHRYFLADAPETFHNGGPFMVTAELEDPEAIAEELLAMI